MGRDDGGYTFAAATTVSIHAPRMGRDYPVMAAITASHVFQFTRPAWGATRIFVSFPPHVWFQFTRPAWGATKSKPTWNA